MPPLPPPPEHCRGLFWEMNRGGNLDRKMCIGFPKLFITSFHIKPELTEELCGKEITGPAAWNWIPARTCATVLSPFNVCHFLLKAFWHSFSVFHMELNVLSSPPFHSPGMIFRLYKHPRTWICLICTALSVFHIYKYRDVSRDLCGDRMSSHVLLICFMNGWSVKALQTKWWQAGFVFSLRVNNSAS